MLSAAEGPAPKPPVSDTFELHWVSQNVSKVTYLHFSATFITLSPLPLQNLGLVPTGKFWMTSLHVICGLGLPNQKFWLRLLPEKLFWRPVFFFENTCGCVLGPWPWPRAFLSLASRGSVLERLSLASSLLSSTPPLLGTRYLKSSSTAAIWQKLLLK